MLLIAAVSSEAQVGNATLSVQAVDEEGTVVSGLMVEAVNTETGFRRSTTTDEDGTAIMPALPVGAYEVRAIAGEMSAPAEQAIILRVGQQAQLRLVLQPQVTDAVTVTGEIPLVDVHKMDSSTNIIPEQIESLPVADRQFENLAFLAPGTQRDRIPFFDRTGSPVIGGSGNAAQSTILVDGVDFSDPFIGQARLRLSQDAIREFRVVGQGFDAEVGGTAGGGLSVVTKSGTNQVQASAFTYARDEALRAQGALEIETADYSRYHAGFTVGGPLARDRTHYFTAFEHLDEDQVALVRPGGVFVGFADDVVRPKLQTTALVTLNHSFSASSDGTARLFWERYRQDNYTVGGVIDESRGWSWDRDAWTLVLGHTRIVGGNRLNELRFQAGARDVFGPANTVGRGEDFTFGVTLKTGGNGSGKSTALEGSFLGLRNSFHWQPPGGRHQFKAGLEYQYVDEFYSQDLFLNPLMVYATDSRLFPALYWYGVGSSAHDLEAHQFAFFAQDDWRIRDTVTVAAGLRYDHDVGSNNPDLEQSLSPDRRQSGYGTLQPRLAFTWDAGGRGRTVVRGGVGRFAGRYNHYNSHVELLGNGVIGRTVLARVSIPPYFMIDPADPENTGYPLSPFIGLMDDDFPPPESTQARLGVSQQLGARRLHVDVEGVYAEGRNEHVLRNTNWGGNDNPGVIYPEYTHIWTFTAEGRSRYRALSLGLNGMLGSGHLITAGVIVADKENLQDDPIQVESPSDSANMEGEWGRAGASQRFRLVASGVFRLPWGLTLSSVYEYGSGQPWNRIYGYDFNGDLDFYDRPEGVDRNDQDGPRFSQLDLSLAKELNLPRGGTLNLILEVFNLFDTTNFDVLSVDSAMYFSGPTLMDPGQAFIPNPGFGTYRDTHRPREAQIGLRWRV
jgi:hypothetical protein